MKKRYAILLMLTFGCFVLRGQSPILDHWFLNNFLVNPAIAGIEKYWDVQLGNRVQWSGIDGAPSTIYLTTHAPLHNPRPKKGLSKTVNPSRRDLFTYDNFPHKNHWGLGGTVLLDQIGPFRNIEANLAGSYHMQIRRTGHYLSVGLSAGIFYQDFDLGFVDPALQNDPTVLNQQNSGFRPTLVIRPGVWFYGDQYYMGVSYSNLRHFSNESENSTMITAGYRFDTNIDSWHLTPYFLVRINSITTVRPDVGLKVDLRREFYGGVTWRYSSYDTVLYLGYSGHFRYSVTALYTVGGSKSLSDFSSGTYEVQVNLKFKNKEKIPCPQKMW